jgi:hypothetical protein
MDYLHSTREAAIATATATATAAERQATALP